MQPLYAPLVPPAATPHTATALCSHSMHHSSLLPLHPTLPRLYAATLCTTCPSCRYTPHCHGSMQPLYAPLVPPAATPHTATALCSHSMHHSSLLPLHPTLPRLYAATLCTTRPSCRYTPHCHGSMQPLYAPLVPPAATPHTATALCSHSMHHLSLLPLHPTLPRLYAATLCTTRPSCRYRLNLKILIYSFGWRPEIT